MSGNFHVLAVLPPGKHPGSRRIGGWVGPTVGLDILEKREVPNPCRDSIPCSSIPSPILTELTQLQFFDFMLFEILKSSLDIPQIIRRCWQFCYRVVVWYVETGFFWCSILRDKKYKIEVWRRNRIKNVPCTRYDFKL